MGRFGAAHGWCGESKNVSLSKACHTYPTMLKLVAIMSQLKRIKKTYKPRDTRITFCWY